MINNTQKTLKGTVLKMVVNFEYPQDRSVTLATMENWYTEWYCKGRKFLVKKNDHIQDEDGTWYALVDTGVTGDGILKMRLWAGIPDRDAVTGVRPEYAEVVTNVMIG